MTEVKSKKKPRIFSSEVIIASVLSAIIGAVASIKAAEISITPVANAVTAEYMDYEPTNDLKTEIRYLLEITGFKELATRSQNIVLENNKAAMHIWSLGDSKLYDKGLQIYDEEAEKFKEKATDLLVEIMDRKYGIEEVQELNKFYSTESMKTFTEDRLEVEKIFLIEIEPLLKNSIDRYRERFLEERYSD